MILVMIVCKFAVGVVAMRKKVPCFFVTPRSTSPAAPATDEGATEKEKNEQQRVISFIVSLQPIEENTLLKIALVFDGKELCLLVNDEVVGIEG